MVSCVCVCVPLHACCLDGRHRGRGPFVRRRSHTITEGDLLTFVLMGFYVQSGAHLVRKRFRTCQSVAVSLILARGRSQGDLLVSTQGKEDLIQHIGVHAIVLLSSFCFCATLVMSHGRTAAEVPPASGALLLGCVPGLLCCCCCLTRRRSHV